MLSAASRPIIFFDEGGQGLSDQIDQLFACAGQLEAEFQEGPDGQDHRDGNCSISATGDAPTGVFAELACQFVRARRRVRRSHPGCCFVVQLPIDLLCGCVLGVAGQVEAQESVVECVRQFGGRRRRSPRRRARLLLRRRPRPSYPAASSESAPGDEPARAATLYSGLTSLATTPFSSARPTDFSLFSSGPSRCDPMAFTPLLIVFNPAGCDVEDTLDRVLHELHGLLDLALDKALSPS